MAPGSWGPGRQGDRAFPAPPGRPLLPSAVTSVSLPQEFDPCLLLGSALAQRQLKINGPGGGGGGGTGRESGPSGVCWLFSFRNTHPPPRQPGPPWPLHCLGWILCPVCPTHRADGAAAVGSPVGQGGGGERWWLRVARRGPGLLQTQGGRALWPPGPPPRSQCPGEGNLRLVGASPSLGGLRGQEGGGGRKKDLARPSPRRRLHGAARGTLPERLSCP